MIPALLLFISTVVYRVILGYHGGDNSWLPNFAPLAAIALCGPLIFQRRFLAFALPLAILIASDILLNVHYGVAVISGEMVTRYVALGMISLVGMGIRDHARSGGILLAAASGSMGFYLLTNTASWLAAPGYAKTLAGWVQALTLGLPGYPPTWMFLRNSLVSDLLFTTIILCCLALGRTHTTRKSALSTDVAAQG